MSGLYQRAPRLQASSPRWGYQTEGWGIFKPQDSGISNRRVGGFQTEGLTESSQGLSESASDTPGTRPLDYFSHPGGSGRIVAWGKGSWLTELVGF